VLPATISGSESRQFTPEVCDIPEMRVKAETAIAITFSEDDTNESPL
jgi:hypothetical protein